MNFPPQTSMFKSFNKSFYSNPVNGKQNVTIFGFDESQNKYLPSSDCCSGTVSASLPSGGQAMNSFYPTIWKHNKQNVMVHKMAFGDNCCI
jgi:hypothetical protein